VSPGSRHPGPGLHEIAPGEVPGVDEAPFVPRRGRTTAIIATVATLVVFGGVALLVPGPEAGGAFGPADRFGTIVIGLMIAAFLLRYAMIRATPTDRGLVVRNLFLTTTVPWDRIEQVRLPSGAPWPRLDLVDGDEIAVMGAQRADGQRGRAEVRRLATVVASRTGRIHDGD